ncbi:MAG: ABC transporter ATP-binding protein [Firmicutes bacterium]|nr:ABC transporter ATP-binding protein [Bacillota bacterium]
MDDNVAIEVTNVTKSFRVHAEKNSTLKERLLYARRSKFRDFTALQDVSIRVPKGKTVALIGVNGSGKSTLLKLISRIIYPDKGSISVRGRVSSLLELGAGFHPEFSGYENIYMNAALLGLRRQEIDNKIDEISHFSELGDFLREPVRSYSSGMYMRLAFAVAVAVEPEILLVDEVLSVGDAPFQAKCLARIRRLREAGKTIVIVTHDMGAVDQLCDHVVWLHNSQIRKEGKPSDCVPDYLEQAFQGSFKPEGMSFDRVELGPERTDGHRQTSNGGQGIRLATPHIDAKGAVPTGGDITFDFDVDESARLQGRGKLQVKVFRDDDVLIYENNTASGLAAEWELSKLHSRFRLRLSNVSLLAGRYNLHVCFYDEDGHTPIREVPQVHFEVYDVANEKGVTRIPLEMIAVV